MALLLQRVGHLVVAFRHPQQRAHRIAERGRLDDASQILDQRRVPARQMPPAATLAAHRPFGRSAVSRSFCPRPMVERASPVISETASRPPHPAARTSPAANTRRPRSSSFEPTDSHLCRIACVSIMPTRILPQRHPKNPAAPSQITTWRPAQSDSLVVTDVLSDEWKPFRSYTVASIKAAFGFGREYSG